MFVDKSKEGDNKQPEKRGGQLRDPQVAGVSDGTRRRCPDSQPEFCPPCFPVTPVFLCQTFVNSKFMHTASPNPHLEKALSIYIIVGSKIKPL